MPEIIQKQSAWRANNKERVLVNVRNNVRKALYAGYGLKPGEYETIYQRQGGVCAICKANPRGKRPLYVDHCHTTGVVRGLLCHGCNTGIGFLKDDPELLRKAIKYLIKKRQVC